MDRKAWSAKTHGRTSFCPPCRYFSLRFLRLTSLDGRLLDSKKTLEEESIEDGDSISAIVQTPRSLWLLKMFEAFLWISRNMWRQLQWVHSGHTAWNSKCNIHMTGHRQEPCFVASLYAKTGKVGPSLLLSYSCILDLPSSLPSNFTRTKKHSAIVSWVYSSKSWTTKNGYPEFENRPKHPQPFVVFGTSHRSCLKYVYGIRDDHTNQTWYIIHHHTNSTNVNISPKADRLDRRSEASQGWPLRNLLLPSAVMAW